MGILLSFLIPVVLALIVWFRMRSQNRQRPQGWEKLFLVHADDERAERARQWKFDRKAIPILLIYFGILVVIVLIFQKNP